MSIEHIDNVLEEMVRTKASDAYLTVNAVCVLRIQDVLHNFSDALLTAQDVQRFKTQLLNAEQIDEFESTLELNTAVSWRGTSRFRVNVFRQQGCDGMVIRRIEMDIPDMGELLLPEVYGQLVLQKRGLILVCGPTGAGKSTTLAAMVGHRNQHGSGHIITVEDPIEYVHQPRNCIITQRDVGLDTYSYSIALKNALRQRPDLVVIGEIRDREVMEQAIYFAETSHLCIATLHANNAAQAIERILNFFPEERHAQVLQNLALNLRAVLSQRLVDTLHGSKALALEIMLNRGFIKQLIEDGKISELREMIEKGTAEGMRSFDQSLIALISSGIISEEVAFAESDSPANMRVALAAGKPMETQIKHTSQSTIRLAGQANDF